MDLPRAKFASGDGEEDVFPGNGVPESDDDAPVSVDVRMRLALASSKEISANGADGDRSVQPGRPRSATLASKFCGEKMAVTGEDMLLVLIGDVRNFDVTEEFGTEILAWASYFAVDPMENDSVIVTPESQCGKVSEDVSCILSGYDTTKSGFA